MRLAFPSTAMKTKPRLPYFSGLTLGLFLLSLLQFGVKAPPTALADEDAPPAAVLLENALRAPLFSNQQWSTQRVQELLEKLRSLSPLFAQQLLIAQERLKGDSLSSVLRACQTGENFSNPWRGIHSDYVAHFPPLTPEVPQFSAEKIRQHQRAFEALLTTTAAVAWTQYTDAPMLCIPVTLSLEEGVIALSHIVGMLAHDFPIALFNEVRAAPSLQNGLEALIRNSSMPTELLKQVTERAYIQHLIQRLRLPSDELSFDEPDAEWIDFESQSIRDETGFIAFLLENTVGSQVKARWKSWIQTWVRSQIPARIQWIDATHQQLLPQLESYPEAQSMLNALEEDRLALQREQCILITQLIELTPSEREAYQDLNQGCEEILPPIVSTIAPEAVEVSTTNLNEQQQAETESILSEENERVEDPTLSGFEHITLPLLEADSFFEDGINWTPMW